MKMALKYFLNSGFKRISKNLALMGKRVRGRRRPCEATSLPIISLNFLAVQGTEAVAGEVIIFGREQCDQNGLF